MTTNDDILKRLLSESPVAYHPMLAHACGGATVALFLSQLLYWTGKSKLANGWFWKSATELQRETGLTRNEQETARKKLVSFGIIETKLRGVPATMHFRVDFDKLCERLAQFGENSQSSLAKSDKLVSGFSPNLIGEKQQTIHRLPETTPENTTVEQQREKPKQPRRAKAAPPPPIEAFRKAAHKYPNRAIWATIESAVAADTTSLERWESVVRAYIGMGWNPANVAGMLDYYKRGEIPAPRNSNGRNGKPEPCGMAIVSKPVAEGDFVSPDEFFGGAH